MAEGAPQLRPLPELARQVPATTAPGAAGMGEEENRRLEFLLRLVGESKLWFLRNGTLQQGHQVAAFLRQWWDERGRDARTAREFIAAYAAATATASRDPASPPDQVILQDGRTSVPLAVWLEMAREIREVAAHDPGTFLAAPARGPQRLRELLERGPALFADLDEVIAEATDPALKARGEKVREALRAPAETAAAVLACIENSGATFFRAGSDGPQSYTAAEFCAHLQKKALQRGYLLDRPAPNFIEEMASRSSRHKRYYRVRLPSGEELDVRDWLTQRFKLGS